MLLLSFSPFLALGSVGLPFFSSNECVLRYTYIGLHKHTRLRMLACLCMTGPSDKVQRTMSQGEWCEKTTESSPEHLFFKWTIIYKQSSPVLHHIPPLFTSLGKEDTEEKMKSNLCMSGTLHESFACVAATISLIIGLFTCLCFYSGLSVTIMHLGMPHGDADDFWCGVVRLDWMVERGGMERYYANYPSQWQRVHGGRGRDALLWAVSCAGLNGSQPCHGLIIFINLLSLQGQ